MAIGAAGDLYARLRFQRGAPVVAGRAIAAYVIGSDAGSGNVVIPSMMELLTSPEAWAALLTLTALEIVLGIDNVIFISRSSAHSACAGNARARSACCWRWYSASCCSACWCG
jgi:hypothetical protein